MCSCSTLIYMQYIYFHNFSSTNESSRTHTHTRTEYRKYVKNVWASWFHLFTTIWAQQMLLFLTTWLDLIQNRKTLHANLREHWEREHKESATIERAHKKCRLPVAVCSLIIKLAQALTLALSLGSLSSWLSLCCSRAQDRSCWLQVWFVCISRHLNVTVFTSLNLLAPCITRVCA